MQENSTVEELATDAAVPIVDFRQYTLHEGRRDTLIDIFEREFIAPQHALGMQVIGTFRDADRPNRFVWLRGFKDMGSRWSGLTDFYGGPVWQAHRDAANATMIDSDNVLLLHAPTAAAAFQPRADRPAGMILVAIHYLRLDPADALVLFEREVKPALDRAGVDVLAWFGPEQEANTSPKIPVREGERVLVWFARFASADDLAAKRPAIDQATAPLAPLIAEATEFVRLLPTSRSQLR